MRRLFASTLAIAAALAVSAKAQDPFTVFFDLGSAEITSDGMAIINAAAAEYRETGSTSVSIIGHTDTTGSREFNMQLSQRRAEAVAAELRERGVPPDEVILGWRGQDDLAVETADNVAEPRNRRAEIAVAEASVAPPPPPPPAPSRFSVGIGPYVGFSFEDDGEEGVYLGANATASYFVTPNIALTGEQAIFYNTFGPSDDGIGSRTAIGADYHLASYGSGEGVLPFVGVNAGYLTIDGTGTGGFFAGPEAGLSVYGVNARVAYDFVEDRDADEGVISLTLGYEIRF
jgi:hypothetical protein